MFDFWKEVTAGLPGPCDQVHDIECSGDGLKKIRAVQGPGVYVFKGEIKDLKSEVTLYVGRTESTTRDVGQRAYEQLYSRDKTFQTNVREKGYTTYFDYDSYDCMVDKGHNAVYVRRALIYVFESTPDGFNSRDTCESALLRLGLFNLQGQYRTFEQMIDDLVEKEYKEETKSKPESIFD